MQEAKTQIFIKMMNLSQLMHLLWDIISQHTIILNKSQAH